VAADPELRLIIDLSRQFRGFPFQNLAAASSQNHGALLDNANQIILSETMESLRMSNKLEQIAVRLEPELRERLQRAADQDQRPLAGLVRKILWDATKQDHAPGAHAA
jgi:hypothetical protein